MTPLGLDHVALRPSSYTHLAGMLDAAEEHVVSDNRFVKIEQDRIDQVIRDVTEPSFELVLEAGAADGMRDGTARDAFRGVLGAAVGAQQAGDSPTDAALHRHGAPPPDSTKRFLHRVDLGNLPGAQTRTALDAELVQRPARIVVEAHTEPTTGPDKIGTKHLCAPPGVPAPAPPGAPNTVGGIAAALAVAECGRAVLPVGDVPIHQGWWNPQNYPADLRDVAEAALRQRGDFSDAFISGPEDVAEALLARFASVEKLRAWDVRIEGVIIAGGRLRTGFPHPSREFGTGVEDRYLGSDLAALRRIRAAGFVPFFEVPVELRGAGAAHGPAACNWTFRVGGEALSLRDLERSLFDESSAWRPVARDIVAPIAAEGTSALWLPTSATAPDTAAVDVQLVVLLDPGGPLDMYVSAMSTRDEEDVLVERLVRLAAEESGRRLPGSPLASSVRALLEGGAMQRNQRRRHPDRRSFAALAQTAFGVLELARTIDG